MQQVVVSIGPHPTHPRLLRVVRGRGCDRAVTGDGVPAAECGTRLADAAPDLVAAARRALTDRALGGLTVEPEPGWDDDPHLAPFCEAVAAAVGSILPEDRGADGRPRDPQNHVEIPLRYAPDDVGRRLHFADPARCWPLHTDRALKADAGDFLLVAKAEERGATGGRIRLLHVDDIDGIAGLAADPLGARDLVWNYDTRLAPFPDQFELRRLPGVRAPVFTRPAGGLCVRYTDARFRRPSSPDHARYLDDLGRTIEAEAARRPAFDLPVGGMYLINNRTVLHGREGFVNHPGFSRRLLRLCGNLPPDAGGGG